MNESTNERATIPIVFPERKFTSLHENTLHGSLKNEDGSVQDVCRLLRTGVFAPDVQHEDGGDEQQRHHEHRNGTNLDARGIVGVEAPHATGSGASVAIPGSGRGRGGFTLF